MEKNELIVAHHEALSRCRLCPDMVPPVIIGQAVVAEILLIGQAPGDKEGDLGRPFAWTAGKTRARLVGRNSVLVLPPGDDFTAYRWPVQGVPLLVIWPDGSLAQVRAFTEYLIRCGSPHVVAPHDDDPEGCLFARPRRVAA